MRLVILLVFIFIAIANSVAQTDFRPGYVITNSKDTLNGFVDYRGEIRNMKVCNFKASLNDSSRTFLPGEIYGYRYSAGKFYVSKDIDSKDFKGGAFVEFLLQGIKNLYYYNNSNYTSYFLETEDGDLMEIRSEEIEIEKEGQKYIKKDLKYLGLLNYAFSDYPGILKELPGVSLSHKGLIKITKKYHDYICTDEACVVYEKVLPVLRVELKPMVGCSFSKLELTGGFFDDVDFDFSVSPYVGLSANIIVPRLNEKLSVLLSSTVNKDYFYGDKAFYRTNGELSRYNYYHIYNTNLTSSVALKYTYPKGNIRPEAFVGAYVNSILNHYTRFYTENINVDKVTTSATRPEILGDGASGFMGGIGAEYVIFKKFRAFTNLTYYMGGDSEYLVFTSKITSFHLSAGLTF